MGQQPTGRAKEGVRDNRARDDVFFGRSGQWSAERDGAGERRVFLAGVLEVERAYSRKTMGKEG